MSDRNGGSILGYFIDGLLDCMFTVGVQGAGGLVQKKDPGVPDHGSGDRNPLFLPPGKPDSLFTDLLKKKI